MNRRLITGFQFLKKGVQTTTQAPRYYLRVLQWIWNARKAERPPKIDPFRVIETSPSRIEYQIYPEPYDIKDVGRVASGNWDQQKTKIEDHGLLYDGMVKRYEKGIPWEQTEFFKENQRRIQEGESRWGVKTIAELHERYNTLDDVYKSMESDGYKPNKSMVDSKTIRALDEILVHISRDGELLFAGEGNHRIRLAKLLDLDQISVRVCVRHKVWQEKRNRIVTGGATPEDFDVTPSHPDIEFLFDD